MDIALDKVCGLIVRAREIDVKEGITDPASGSNPIDDGWTDVLTSAPGDATEAEIRDMIAGLNEDERHDLIALVYIGRGDLEPEEWGAAVRLAREREDASRLSTSRLAPRHPEPRRPPRRGPRRDGPKLHLSGRADASFARAFAASARHLTARRLSAPASSGTPGGPPAPRLPRCRGTPSSVCGTTFSGSVM